MFDLSVFTTSDAWLALLTLTVMEIVLGIDNIVFVSILAGELPEKERPRARTMGLGLALIFRVGLLFAIKWVMGLEETLFSLFGHGFSGRDLILATGGLFLLAKSTHEIFDKLENADHSPTRKVPERASFAGVIIQIVLLDMVFSIDSVVTAVGMAESLLIMIIAVVIAAGFMIAFSGPVGRFVNRHPSMKILALSFLLLIGVLLVAESLGQHISKGYIYFAMAFSFMVELINMRLRKKQKPIALHNQPTLPTAD
ncbi:MAG TPA: TerC family protein [Kofleriaceae bacterium]|nr:TerC family protein [Kofleriaceae bacterium]